MFKNEIEQVAKATMLMYITENGVFHWQAAGALGGALAIMEAIPEQYKHLIGGPSLKVDTHTGAIAEGVLTFLIAFDVLFIILRGPQSSIFKTWLISIVVVTLVTFGSAYTGPSIEGPLCCFLQISSFTLSSYCILWL
ncbi:Aquaporin SIP1-1 [Hibiscus syriacus]|uniref:Aquaporin SIP1-1 n=1 Tax=Hibiscus syriacus TaxID=106335 RepID=A0A6A2Z072_HIBSY|nr:Aquaporin SIP1-1 [Hibiscus syriacus]